MHTIACLTVSMRAFSHMHVKNLLKGPADEEQAADSEWYDQFDEKVFNFKYKMVKWLKEADLNNEEVKSRMSSKSGSSRSCK